MKILLPIVILMKLFQLCVLVVSMGVHLGHQELLKFTEESSNLFQIVTFDILPKKYFNNEHKLLTTNNEKIELFKKFEPSNLVFINFEHVMKFSPKTFCEMLKTI